MCMYIPSPAFELEKCLEPSASPSHTASVRGELTRSVILVWYMASGALLWASSRAFGILATSKFASVLSLSLSLRTAYIARNMP